ncbi:hypothetical protein N7478_012937 [Penicillium angulare]|uniref:uncharacterized protein n=1 Tax=Penicillium angulare TaxID=116970 RepID=UPI00253FC9F9|nr:uncharacterized protein N7478_012937 [Penicillium angulare]KAJ5256833.1 hypothetical protein N7478_012937 [Penicillium angulare]
MLSSIDYESLCDFQGLPIVRETLTNQSNGFVITGMPPVTDEAFVDLEREIGRSKLLKKDLPGLAESSSSSISSLFEVLHKTSQQVFKNLSHALELPWERYLGEMHEFTADGQDEIRIIKPNHSLPNAWSTLTLVIDQSSPSQAVVLYGAALAVFSEGNTAISNNPIIVNSLLLKTYTCDSGDRLVYYVRPNDGVFYTRTAGALMTPLSGEEHASRKRVREITSVA